jgi:PAS domain S-box-containing protein
MMDYKFINYIPLIAMVVDKQSGDIICINSRFSEEVSKNIKNKKVFDFFSIKYFSEKGEFSEVKLIKNGRILQSGVLNIENLDENSNLITFKENCSLQFFKYKEIFESAADGLVVVDKKFNIREVNDAFCNIVEIEKEELVGKNSFNLAYKYADIKTAKSLIYNLKNVLTGNSIKRLDIEYIGKTLSVSMNSPETSKYYIGIVRDISDRVKASIALQRSEEQYKTLINSSLDGINIVIDGKFEYVNPMMTKILGYSENELIGMPFINVVADEEKKRAFDAFKNLQSAKNTPNQYQSIAVTKSNKKLFVDVIAVPMNYQGKKAVQIILRDITEKVKALHELKESEEKFRFLSKSTFEGILVHHKGKILDVNDSFAQLTGYSREESLGENILDYIPNLKDRAKAIYNMSLQIASPYIIGIKTKKDASIKVEIQAKNVQHKGKKVRIAAVRDVTEREKIQKQLEDSEKRYRAVFENTGAASCILEKDGTISLANSKFAELSGYSIGEIQNKKSWMQFVDPKDLKRMKEQHSLRRSDSGKALTQYEFTFIDKFKNKKEILLVIDMIEGSDKSVASLLDITYLKETEQKLLSINKDLKKAKEKAEESDHLKSAFLANMSHEIRTPMNGIMGFASLLEEPDITGDEQKQYVEVIKRGGQRMLDTVNDLIDISKIETGQVQVHISDVNINSEIDDLYRFFKPEAERKGLKLYWTQKLPESKQSIQTDQQKFISIITNLIKNAIKYSDSGQIEIKSEVKRNKIYFNVIDTGIGIPKKRVKAIFNRFEQVDFTDTRAFDGSGLGLAISKAYVEMLGGEISCNSIEGKGSDFQFYLPLI